MALDTVSTTLLLPYQGTCAEDLPFGRACALWQYLTECRPVALAIQGAQLLYREILLRPLVRLYLNGPSLHGFGFWAGRPLEDICSSIGGAPAVFWIQNRAQCVQLVWAHFVSFAVAVETVLYAFVLYKTVQAVWRCCLMRWANSRDIRKRAGG